VFNASPPHGKPSHGLVFFAGEQYQAPGAMGRDFSGWQR